MPHVVGVGCGQRMCPLPVRRIIAVWVVLFQRATTVIPHDGCLGFAQ